MLRSGTVDRKEVFHRKIRNLSARRRIRCMSHQDTRLGRFAHEVPRIAILTAMNQIRKKYHPLTIPYVRTFVPGDCTSRSKSFKQSWVLGRSRYGIGIVIEVAGLSNSRCFDDFATAFRCALRLDGPECQVVIILISTNLTGFTDDKRSPSKHDSFSRRQTFVTPTAT